MSMPQKPDAESMQVADTLRLYARATWKHKALALSSFILPVSNVILGVFMPYLASKTLADIVTHSGQPWLHFWWLLAVTGLGFAANFIGIRASVAIQARVMSELHDSMFSRILHRSAGFYSNQIGGKLVSDALDFVSSYGNLFVAAIVTSLGFALTIIIGLTVVIVSNWILGAALAVLLSGLAWWTVRGIRKRSALRAERLKVSKQLVAHLSDNIVNAITVKTFAQEQSEIAHSKEISKKLASIRSVDWLSNVSGESGRMGVLLYTQVVLIAVLIWLTRDNPTLLAAGIFAFTYTLTLINRFLSINSLARQIEESFLQAAPMTKLLMEPIEIVDTPGAKALKVTRGEIVCKDVTFHYADAKSTDNVFEHLNLSIKPGEKIGLVGYSGGGKSTLTRLLLRFDDISEGSISIDGQDIRSVTQTSLRAQISYVPQEPLLFHRSIRDNIAYGNSAASLKQIKHAASLAYAHDFIADLPDKYDTIVGERGVKLSGGQRQRIAIARAILKDAPILVLDEATSALDSESEKLIQKALWELMDNRTAIVIAHRLSTIQKMDRIIVLDGGNLVEQGTHKQLLAAKGTYAKLWTHQSGGFIEE